MGNDQRNELKSKPKVITDQCTLRIAEWRFSEVLPKMHVNWRYQILHLRKRRRAMTWLLASNLWSRENNGYIKGIFRGKSEAANL
jgi:hypothetical protein